MGAFWFGDVTPEGCLPAGGPVPALAARFAAIPRVAGSVEPARPQDAIAAGIARDRAEYIAMLRELAFEIASSEVSRQALEGDDLLVAEVRALSALDEAINLLTEKAVEWYMVGSPEFSRKFRHLTGVRALGMVEVSGDHRLTRLTAAIRVLHEERKAIQEEIAAHASHDLPNTSALAGGLIAARLLETAGSLSALAQMPGSRIQVIGAGTALFSHITAGTPPPKHGILYQHPRIHRAPRDRRGRIARALGARLAIAARIDWYRREADPEFLAASEKVLSRAGGRR